MIELSKLRIMRDRYRSGRGWQAEYEGPAPRNSWAALAHGLEIDPADLNELVLLLRPYLRPHGYVTPMWLARRPALALAGGFDLPPVAFYPPANMRRRRIIGGVAFWPLDRRLPVIQRRLARGWTHAKLVDAYGMTHQGIMSALRAALNLDKGLSPKRRNEYALWLRDRGHTYREIAERIDVSTNMARIIVVKAQERRARERARQRADDALDGGPIFDRALSLPEGIRMMATVERIVELAKAS